MEPESRLALPTNTVEGVDVSNATISELQLLFSQISNTVNTAEPQVNAMRNTAAEAEMILNEMKHRRGKVAYWLTLRKAQR